MSKLVLSCPAYQLFIDSCRAKKTKETYEASLKSYMLFRNVSSADSLLAEDVKQSQSKIIEYIILQKKNGLSWQTRVIRAAALKHFYEMNDVTLNWKKITRFIGEKTRTVEDRAYTKEEVRRMLDKCDERKRVMILLLASTGMRVGALPQLKVKHLVRVSDSLYQFTVYAGTTSQYTTFCTPECAQAIDDYLDYRKRCGEMLSQDSPLIREQFDRNDQFRSVKARHIAQSTLMNTIKQVLLDAGLRSRMPEVVVSGVKTATHRRKEVMQIHGLRKFYDTATTQAGVHPLYVEMLLGHDIALKGSYFKPTVKDLLEGNDKMLGYVAGITALTISEEDRLKLKVAGLQKETEEAKIWREKYEQDKTEFEERMEKKLEMMFERIDVGRLQPVK